MRASFNVLDRAWIPVRTREGCIIEMGIRDVLAQAHNLNEISIASPIEEYSLYRFLGVFLMDALRPESGNDIEDLLKEEAFNMDRIEDYISMCQDEGVSFDLLDENKPFLQVVFDKSGTKKPEPVGRISASIPSGTSHIHFDHRDLGEIEIPYNKAIRLLLAEYVFTRQGGSGYSPGINGTPPYMVLVRGKNLFETLINQLVPTEAYNDIDSIPVLWRNTEPIPSQAKKKISHVSFLLGELFPARRIQLLPNQNVEAVTSIVYEPGFKFEGGGSWKDPAVAYRILNGKRDAIKPQKEKYIWRNYTDLVCDDRKCYERPALVSFALERSNSKWINLSLYGIQADQAKIIDCMKHDLTISVIIADDSRRSKCVERAINASEELAGSIEKTLRKAMQHEDEKKQKKKNKTSRTIKNTIQYYWKQCEDNFFTNFQSKLIENDSDINECYRDWILSICDYAYNSIDWILRQVYLRSKELCLLEGAKDFYLNKTIKKLKKEVKQ